MKVLGIRFCAVDKAAQPLAEFLDSLGLERRPLESGEGGAGDEFPGAVFPAGADSWIEMWPPSAGLPEGIMLQIVVDDADAFAEHARERGLAPQGPLESGGERIYFLRAPTGMPVSFQSVPD
jgi:hypothetical protein